MTNGSRGEVTNEAIAEAFDLWAPMPDELVTFANAHLAEVPDYLHDHAYLKEAERICKERDWEWSVGAFGLGDARHAFAHVHGPEGSHIYESAGVIDPRGNPALNEYGMTIPQAAWTAIVRAHRSMS